MKKENSIEEILGLLNHKSIFYVLNQNNYYDFGFTINKALESNQITNFHLNYSIQESILNQAREDYNIMLDKSRPYQIYPDHLFMPECLAYAIGRKIVFTKDELEKIPFDHGQTYETFPKLYEEEKLVDNIREELLK